MSEHIVDLISAYVDNELTEHEQKRVEEHLSDCPECFTVFNDLMRVKNEVSQAFHSIEAPKSVEDRVLQAIQNPVPSESSQKRYWLFVPLLSPLMLFAIIFTLYGSFVFKLASVGWKVIMNLMIAAGSLLASNPYVIAGLIGFSLLLIIGSGFSLSFLLKQNQFRGNRI